MYKKFRLLLIACLVIWYMFVPIGISISVIITSLCIFYSIFFRALLNPIELRKGIPTFFKIDLLLYSFYYLIFYLPYQVSLFDFAVLENNLYFSDTYLDYGNKSLLACTIGLIAFSLGFDQKNYFKKVQVPNSLQKYVYIKLFIYVFIFLGVLLFTLFRTSWTTLISQSYKGSVLGDTTLDGIYFLVSFLMTFLSGVSILVFMRYGKQNVIIWIFLIVCLFYCVGLLLTGDRNTFFIVTLTLISGVFTYIKRISLFKVVLLFASALFVYQVVENFRSEENKNIESFLLAIVNPSSMVEAKISEHSFSITTIATRAAFDLVPGKHDFFYGKFKVIGLGGIIPYSRGLYVESNDNERTSAEFLTKHLSDWSVGSSIIADSYLDFGLLGVIFFLYFLGLIGKTILLKAQSNILSIKWNVIYLITVSTYAQVVRYSFDFILRNIVWSFVIFFVFENIKRKR